MTIKIIPRAPKPEGSKEWIKGSPIREPDWTQKRWMSVIRQALRSLWSRSPVRIRALDRAQVGENLWKCEECGIETHKVEVDHVVASGSIREWEDIGRWAEVTLTASDNEVRVLCKPCHSKKTFEDNRKIREALNEG